MKPEVARIEGIQPTGAWSDPVRTVRIREHGIRYEAEFTKGQKTGFFCDQPDNRYRFAQWVQGRSVMDLCCWTGGIVAASLSHDLFAPADTREELRANVRAPAGFGDEFAARLPWSSH